MEYILMDLELNQPFAFEDGDITTLVPECPFEVIQIGLAKMDSYFDIKETLNLYVKPKLYHRMHPYVKEITGITDERLASEKKFVEIYPQILDFMGNNENIICIWGPSDVKFLYRNIMYYKLEHGLLPKQYINVQQYAGQFLKLSGNMTIGLKNAVEAFHIKTDIDFHDALNDAIYTGKIFKKLKDSNLDLNVMVFDQQSQISSSKKNYAFSTKHLYKEAEKLFGRKISNKEKEVVKKIYALGRSKKFDSKVTAESALSCNRKT